MLRMVVVVTMDGCGGNGGDESDDGGGNDGDGGNNGNDGNSGDDGDGEDGGNDGEDGDNGGIDGGDGDGGDGGDDGDGGDVEMVEMVVRVVIVVMVMMEMMEMVLMLMMMAMVMVEMVEMVVIVVMMEMLEMVVMVAIVVMVVMIVMVRDDGDVIRSEGNGEAEDNRQKTVESKEVFPECLALEPVSLQMKRGDTPKGTDYGTLCHQGPLGSVGIPDSERRSGSATKPQRFTLFSDASVSLGKTRIKLFLMMGNKLILLEEKSQLWTHGLPAAAQLALFD
ncbi:Hypothetical predicted protein [Marmota monax]|uniref:Uncharacterized protein n=1 Tax=Marmota monax TaxID=9995 RepID=A0A5E4B9J8_MARMO|nr:Hypothetical predicted protein [Marmota monax]